MMRIQFELNEWLGARGASGIQVPKRNTIAQLYATLENNRIVAEKEKVFGFGSCSRAG